MFRLLSKRVLVGTSIVVAISLVGFSIAVAFDLLNLPREPVTATHSAWNTGTLGSTLDVTLSDVPPGYDVTNTKYAGWCGEDNHQPDAQVTLSVLLEPSGVPWDSINYLLNHREGYSAQDVQVAIWAIIGIYDNTFPETPEALALYTEALANSDFVPESGDVVAVLVHYDNEKDNMHQDTFIEVPYDRSKGEGCTPEYWKAHLGYWAATGNVSSTNFDYSFKVNYFKPDISLGKALSLEGDGVELIARHGTAAFLNATHPYVDYPYTVAEVITFVQSKNVEPLIAANELGCKIP